MDANKKKYILLVESDSKLSSLICPFLSTQGFNTLSTHNVTKALQKTESQKYNCIIIQAELKNQKSHELLKQLSNIGNMNKQTPVLLTAQDLAYELPVSLAGRVSEMLLKPFGFDELMTKINKVCA